MANSDAPDPANPESLEELLKRIVPASPDGQQPGWQSDAQHIVKICWPVPFTQGSLAYAVKHARAPHSMANDFDIYLLTPAKNILLAQRPLWVNALAVHGGVLYDGGQYNMVLETVGSKAVAEREGAIQALWANGGRLYDLSDKNNFAYGSAPAGGFLGGHSSQVHDTLANKAVDARNPHLVPVNPLSIVHEGYFYSVVNLHSTNDAIARSTKPLADINPQNLDYGPGTYMAHDSGPNVPFLTVENASAGMSRVTALCSLSEQETQRILDVIRPATKYPMRMA